MVVEEAEPDRACSLGAAEWGRSGKRRWHGLFARIQAARSAHPLLYEAVAQFGELPGVADVEQYPGSPGAQ